MKDEIGSTNARRIVANTNAPVAVHIQNLRLYPDAEESEMAPRDRENLVMVTHTRKALLHTDQWLGDQT
jgi:hypothetical protein